ncbi:MAG: methyltransferase domain-containing protein [Pseudomonadota bacterium]
MAKDETIPEAGHTTNQTYAGMFAGHDKSREKRVRNGAYVADAIRTAFKPKTLIDLGCGLGFFLSAMAQKGSDVTGVDNGWVSDLQTEIPHERYTFADLNKPFETDTRFDMAVSFECAEHLARSRADGFVADLCKLSDTIAFSAAVPGQGGSGHRNPQWQGYWAALFAEQGYECYDYLRPQLAANEDAFLWFRQNPLIYIKQGARVPVKVRPFRIEPEAASHASHHLFMRHRHGAQKRIKELEAKLAAST